VWPQRESAPYLYGIRDRLSRHRDSFCSWTGKFRWRHTFSGKQLGVILRKTLPDELGIPGDEVGSLVDVSIKERSPSGRVRVLEITTTRGVFEVEGDRIRWVLALDPWQGKILQSTMFNIQKKMRHRRLSLITIRGGGNGHGVGMCQNGAIGMARKGYTYRMILEHYYPGTILAKRY
jgi:stage II sporulation protein D